MALQNLFERVEQKYCMTAKQYRMLAPLLEEWFVPDKYAKSTVMSLYYDTPDYAFIRRSLDKPAYKEKLRLRSYGVPKDDSTVFLELKKKFAGVVYKRRLPLTCRQATDYFLGRAPLLAANQTARELDRFTQRYPLEPKAMLCCERLALAGTQNPDLRATFDQNLRWRAQALSLAAGAWGEPLLFQGQVLMELKTIGALPNRLARVLSGLGIFPSTFSKYGLCYSEHLAAQFAQKGGMHCA